MYILNQPAHLAVLQIDIGLFFRNRYLTIKAKKG